MNHELMMWIAGSLGSVIVLLFGYMLSKNITVLESLSQIVTDLRIDLAGHKVENNATRLDVEALKTKVVDLEHSDFDRRIKIEAIETTIRRFEDGRK